MFFSSGSHLIEKAIGRFERIAAQIEAGVAKNCDQIDANKRQIEALDTANVSLHKDAHRGQSVAAKLRQLIS